MIRRFDRVTRLLVLIAVLAFGVRVAYIALAKRGPCTISVNGVALGVYHSECTGDASSGNPNDQVYYNAAANHLAAGGGFTEPLPPRTGPAADHPPLTVVALAAVSFAFDHPPLVWLADQTRLPTSAENGKPPGQKIVYTHVREHRYFMAFVGAINVLLIGLLARRIGGDRVAIVAASLAALYPNIWVNDALLFSESLAILCVVSALLLSLRCIRRPTLPGFAALGAICALAALARAELLLFVPLLVLPAAWWALRDRGVGFTLARAAVGCGVAALVLVPWIGYNQARFTSRVLLSTNDGLALAASNCDRAYSGPGLGLWTPVRECVFDGATLARLGDQSEVSRAYRARAVAYMKEHSKRLVFIVIPARIGRVWSMYRPADMVNYNAGESREHWVSWAGIVTYYLLLVPAVGGAVTLARSGRRRQLWVLAVPAISVTVVAAATYGQTRLRATAEPSLVVLAAIGVVAVAELIARRNSGSLGRTSR